MKQFLITLLAVGVLASAAQAEARLVSKRGECVAACGQAISDGCGWITKRGKFNRCRAKLINQCKHFGTAQVCPPPPPPSSPTGPTATTTLPPPPPTTTTTTTVPYIPPTTTTLPPPPPLTDLRGSYMFEGYVTSDNCGMFGIGYYTPVPFLVTAQSGTDLAGVMGANGGSALGTYTPSTGGWGLGEGYYDSYGCLITTGVGVGNDYGFSSGVGATWWFEDDCSPAFYCYVEATGLVFWN
jgi:hypothetical protein